MGIQLDTAREKLDVTYALFGISADVSQLARAYLRGDRKGLKKNIAQIIKKLGRIEKSLL